MRQRRLLVQVAVAAVLLGLVALLVNNLAVNLIRTGLGLGFGWLGRPAGFALAETALPYAPSDSYLWALTIGWLNSLKVIAAGLVLATGLGVAAGAARGSNNRLAAQPGRKLRGLDSSDSSAAAVAVLVFRCLPWPSLGADRWVDPAFESGYSAVGPEPQR